MSVPGQPTDREICERSLAAIRAVIDSMEPADRAAVESYAQAIRNYLAMRSGLAKIAAMLVGIEVTLESFET